MISSPRVVSLKSWRISILAPFLLCMVNDSSKEFAKDTLIWDHEKTRREMAGRYQRHRQREKWPSMSGYST